jgi:uncharacterized protein (TIGR02246 family)
VVVDPGRKIVADIKIIGHSLSIAEESHQKVLRIPPSLDQFWNERNARGFADLFEVHGDYRFHDGSWIKGRKRIFRHWKEQVFLKLPDSMIHEIETREVRFVTDNIAVVDGTQRIVDRLQEGDHIHLELEMTLIVIKHNQEWLISAVRLAQLPPD